MQPASLAQRMYLLLTIIITIIMLFFGCNDATNTRQRLLKEKELGLVKIVINGTRPKIPVCC